MMKQWLDSLPNISDKTTETGQMLLLRPHFMMLLTSQGRSVVHTSHCQHFVAQDFSDQSPLVRPWHVESTSHAEGLKNPSSWALPMTFRSWKIRRWLCHGSYQASAILAPMIFLGSGLRKDGQIEKLPPTGIA